MGDGGDRGHHRTGKIGGSASAVPSGMATLALTSQGDFDISSGNLRIVTDPAQALATKLQARFRMWRGEWYLDTRQGVPYRELVLVKNPDIQAIRTMFRSVLSRTPGVASVDSFTLTYDRNARSAAYSFRVLTDTGAVIKGGEGDAFVVEVSK